MKAAAGVLAASAIFLAGVLTGFAQDESGGSAPGLVELGDESPATTPATTADPTVVTTAPPPPTVPAVPLPTAPSSDPPPVTIDDDHEEVEHDVGEGDLDDFDDNSGPGNGRDDSGPGGGDD